jgi:hypothetical protein
MGDMSKLFLREIGEPAELALLEPNWNLVLFRIVPIRNLHWELGWITPALIVPATASFAKL